jgi:hypothetical protein
MSRCSARSTMRGARSSTGAISTIVRGRIRVSATWRQEFAASHSHVRSEPAARSAGPAKEMPYGALQRAAVSVEEPDSFSSQPRIG